MIRANNPVLTKRPNCRATAGEIFSNAMIELVADPADFRCLNLLLWSGNGATVAQRVSYENRWYEPVAVDPTVVRAIRWPKCCREYGSTRKLFDQIRDLISAHLEIGDAPARLLTYFVFSTWFPDRLSLAPGLAILGPDVTSAAQLLRLLACICRRSMLMGEVSRSGLLGLPLRLAPTLLMDRPRLNPSLRGFIRASNRRGVGAVTRGKVLDVCCPKVIYFGAGEFPEDLGSSMIQFILPFAPVRPQPLNDPSPDGIAAELQGKLLAYRLSNYSKIGLSQFGGSAFIHETRELAANLAACITDDSELGAGVVPLLTEQDEHARDPERQVQAAIIDAVLTCCHENKGKAQVQEITALTNSVLRTGGEIIECSPEEVGHRLNLLGLSRIRTSAGKVLVLSSGARRLAHRRARILGLSSLALVPSCPDCNAQEPAAESKV